MFKTILVALDGSELAERALAPAFSLAEKFGGEVILLRVPVTLQYVTLPAGTGLILPDKTTEREQQEAEAYLQEIQTKWSRPGAQIRLESVVGTPADVILEVAKRDGVDLIIMSTHGRSGVSRLLYGSVAESVLRNAQMPILLIPAKL